MTVQQWLDSERDYEAGRQLYAALGDNERLKRLLAGGPSRYNGEALAWELGKLAVSSYQLAVNSEQSPADMPKKVQDGPGQSPESSPNATIPLQKEPSGDEKGHKLLAELRDARRPLYDERTGLHAQLEAPADEDARRAVAQRIMLLSRALNQNWDADRHVRAHGTLPPGPPVVPAAELATLPAADLLKRRNNLRSQVSKLKTKPHRAEELARVGAELAQVEALLTHE